MPHRLILSWMVVLISGCATVPRQGGFSEVEQVVSERTGQHVRWNQDADADRAVARAVRDVLDRDLTADAAVQVALLNNRRLQATYEDLGIAQADLVEAGLLKNPTLMLERSLPGQGLALDVTGDFMSLLFLPMRKKVAQAEFAATQQQVAHKVLNLATEARQSFYRLQGAQQAMEMRRSVAAAASASADAARKLHEAGNIKTVDLENELAQADEARLDLAAAEADALEIREGLNRVMGLWGFQAHWTVAARLAELPAVEVATEGLEALALEKRLDLAAGRQEIEALAQRMGISRTTGLIPELNFGGHFEREADGADSFGPSVELSLPIFNQGQPAVARAQARLRQSQQSYVAMAVEIRSEVRVAQQRMMAARQRAEHYLNIVLPRRHRITRETQLQYNAMQVGVFALLQAKRAEIDAGRDYIDALQAYWIARAELAKAVGGSFAGLATSRLSTAPAPATGTAPTTAPTQPAQPQRPPEHPDHSHQHGGHS